MLPIPEVGPLADLLLARGESLCLVEASAGGALQAALSLAPGASRWFHGGLVAYHDSLKTGWLGLDARVLIEHGAVSTAAVEAMGAAALAHCASNWVLVESGVYGPAGGSPEKPVGLVYLHVAHRAGWRCSERLQLAGDRAALRGAVAVQAAKLLIRQLRATGGAGNLK